VAGKQSRNAAIRSTRIEHGFKGRSSRMENYTATSGVRAFRCQTFSVRY
jgi:hypothetical protein